QPDHPEQLLRAPMTFAKALWVVRDKITTPGAIDDLLADSVGWNVRDLVVQVRGRGDAYYTSMLEPRAEALADDLDPLAHLVRGGAAVGVRIHAWANGTFVWSSPSGEIGRASCRERVWGWVGGVAWKGR